MIIHLYIEAVCACMCVCACVYSINQFLTVWTDTKLLVTLGMMTFLASTEETNPSEQGWLLLFLMFIQFLVKYMK